MAAVCILPAYGAQCFGDIGFQSLTCGLILGLAVGVAGKVTPLALSREMARRGDGRRQRPPVSMAADGQHASLRQGS
jgi:hypothetical protein